MSFFDFIYVGFALVTARFWWPALRSFLREIWEIGDPGHRSPISTHDVGRYTPAHRRATTTTAPPPESSAGSAQVRDFRRRSRPVRDLATRRRFEGGFGRRGA